MKTQIMTKTKIKSLTREVFEHASDYMYEFWPEKGPNQKFATLSEAAQETWIEAVRYTVAHCSKVKNSAQPSTMRK
jgi:hypothetical protein